MPVRRYVEVDEAAEKSEITAGRFTGRFVVSQFEGLTVAERAY
jgi:hypothetical protein